MKITRKQGQDLSQNDKLSHEQFFDLVAQQAKASYKAPTKSLYKRHRQRLGANAGLRVQDSGLPIILNGIYICSLLGKRNVNSYKSIVGCLYCSCQILWSFKHHNFFSPVQLLGEDKRSELFLYVSIGFKTCWCISKHFLKIQIFFSSDSLESSIKIPTLSISTLVPLRKHPKGVVRRPFPHVLS